MKTLIHFAVLSIFIYFIPNQINSSTYSFDKTNTNSYIVSINGFAWHDRNGDGKQGGTNENGIDGVVVKLIDNNDSLVATTSTMGGGYYSFTLLDNGNQIPAGTYRIVFNKVMEAFTKSNIGDETIDSDVVFTEGSTDWIDMTSEDNYYNIDAGFYNYISIGDKVWRDTNRDGIQDSSEGYLSNVRVTLFDDSDGSTVLSLTTGGGPWSIINIPPGDYHLEYFPAGGIGTPYAISPIDATNDDEDSDINEAGATISFELISGEDQLNWDAGFYYVFPDGCGFEVAFDCETAPVICDINELNYRCSIMPESNGGIPYPLCVDDSTGYAHNISWWAFVADNTNLEIILHTHSCTYTIPNDSGIQYGIYTDCTYTETVICEATPCTAIGDIPINVSCLEIGKTYYFFIDGCNGTICHYDIEVINGIGIPQILGPDEITCENEQNCDSITTGIETTFTQENVLYATKYTWDINGQITYSSTPDTIITFKTAGNYTLCGKGVNDCDEGEEKCISFEVIKGLEMVTEKTDISCNGLCDGHIKVIEIQNGIPPFTYAWSNGNNSSEISELCEGLYTVTITDSNNKSAKSTYEIVQPEKLSCTISSTNTTYDKANDGTAVANPSGGTKPYTYIWSNGEITQNIDSLNPGMYIVTVTDKNSCSIIDTTIIENKTSTINLDTDNIKIYPNPTSSNFIISFTDIAHSETEIVIYDISGKKKLRIKKQPKGNTISVNTGILNSGMYLIKIKFNDKTYYKKFVLKK